MPQYSFVCSECEDRTPMVYLMKISESDVQEVECWVCGGIARKIPSVSGFELKGGGWYAAGYSKGE